MKKKENIERKGEVEKILLELSALDQKALFERYQSDEEGLDPVQAADRLEEYGRNIIDFGKEKSLAVRIKDAHKLHALARDPHGRLHDLCADHEGHLHQETQGLVLI